MNERENGLLTPVLDPVQIEEKKRLTPCGVGTSL
jgi:hypothetical protein